MTADSTSERRAERMDAGDLRPRPDPTLLTSSLVDKAIAGLREVLEAQIIGLKELFTARFVENEKAVSLHQAIFDRLPLMMDEKVAHAVAIQNERFKGVDTQFVERDVRVKESATATATAVAAALQAAKEAVGEQNKSFTVSIDKSEKATGEQINQLRVQIDTMSKGVDGKIDDIKERLTRIESVAVTNTVQKQDTQTSNSWVLSLVMAGVGVVGLLVTLVVVFGRTP